LIISIGRTDIIELKALSEKRRRLLRDNGWTIALAVFSVAILIFLVRNHSFIPMWMEVIGEFEAGLLTMAGVIKKVPNCWLTVKGFSIPLALTPHIGPAFYYFYLPFAYLWFNQITTDPYVYRYAGIIFFIVDAGIFYYLLRHYFSKVISFYAAVAFLTMPISLLLCLTEMQAVFFMQFFILLSFLFFIKYFKEGKTVYLLLFGLFAGLTLTARIEGFVWPLTATLVYLICARSKVILNKWRETENKLGKVILTGGMFCLGASSFVTYNLICWHNSILTFFWKTILPRSLDASSTSLTGKLLTRLYQFGNHNLLGIWPMYELWIPNVVFAVFWLVCAITVIVMSIVQRKLNYWLVFIPVCIFLSVLTTGGLRYEHLSSLQPVVLVIFASGATYLSRNKSFERALLYFVLPIVILANVMTSFLDWRNWQQQSPTVQTMLNQSDPVLLTKHLLHEHADDRVIYTNIGFSQYVQYMTMDRIKGDDIMNWFSIDDFVGALKAVLMDGSKRRVIVAVSPQRDGREGTLPRTKRMYEVLNEMRIPYSVKSLSNERNQFLYDLVVIEKGIVPKVEVSLSNNFCVDEVVNVRMKSDLLTGSIIGSNFEPGDMVVINDVLTFPATFGNKNWLTFAIPIKTIVQSRELNVQVFRPSTMEMSAPYKFRVEN
jgi:hypothetical protein